MLECTRCGWTGAASTLTCPRCGQPFAPPPPRGRPTLLLRLEASDLPSDDFEIADTSQTVGRLDETDIKIPHKSVSRQHARIVPTPTGFEVEDLGSTNGTYLNDRPISDRTPLANNDLLMFGDVPVRVVLRQAPAAVVAAEAVPEPRWAQPQPEPEPQPRPQPASERVASGNGPSTVYYDLDEALAEAQVQPRRPSRRTTWRCRPRGTSNPRVRWRRPARPLDATPARPLDAAPVQPAAESVEQPTLVGAELVVDPPPPTRDPQPGSSTDPRPRPALDPLPTSAREPLPTSARDPLPTPALDPLPTPALDPLPTPARDPLPTPREATGGSTSEPRSTPALDPRPTPALDPLPTPALDPRPASALDPRPTPALDPRPTPALDPLPASPHAIRSPYPSAPHPTLHPCPRTFPLPR